VLLGIDKDPAAIDEARTLLRQIPRLNVFTARFADLSRRWSRRSEPHVERRINRVMHGMCDLFGTLYSMDDLLGLSRVSSLLSSTLYSSTPRMRMNHQAPSAAECALPVLRKS